MKLIQRDFSIDAPFIDKQARRGWISFGYNNNFPIDVVELANASPLQKSILESKISAVWGAGLKPTEKKQFTPNMVESWSSLIQKLITDFVYLDAFAVQIIVNKSGGSFSFYHQPVDQVRFAQYDDDNMIKTAYLCTDWTRATKRNIVEIKMFGSESPKIGERYLLYCKRERIGELYYAVPQWFSAANWIAADAALSRYYNNFISNNFSASMKVTFPSTPNDEAKKELYENLQKAFGGERNAGNIVLLFGEGGTLPDINPIESQDPNLYNAVTDIVTRQIITANRLTSPALAGVATSAGFSNKAEELIAAWTLYKLSVIQEVRSFILDKCNFLLELNGLDRSLEIQDIDFRKEFEGKTDSNDDVERESVGVTDNEDDEVDNNAKEEEEQEDGK